jgi:hypothetical protein
MTLTCSMLIAFTISTGAVNLDTVPAPTTIAPTTQQSIGHAVQAVPVRQAGPLRKASETWMHDRVEKRPAALPAMYAALGALNVLDVYSTRRAIGSGAAEVNPLMKKAAGSSSAMMAVKALSTAGTIYFSERAWKKNRKGAIVMMALINGATAAITARNFKNAQR